MHAIRLWISILVICASAGVAAADSPPVLAVFEFEDKTGALDGQAREQLTDYLATRLGEGGRFRVVPRDMLHARLGRTKRESYRRCYDTACQVEMGRELAASKIVAPRILRIGSDCRLTLHLYDLGRAATDAAASVKTACGLDALPDAIDRAVVRIGGMPGPSPESHRCRGGQVEIAGHCCWPGQDWGVMSQQCVGEPACPNGFVAEGDGCARGCPRGQVEIAGHCCWPGQDWGTGSGRCIGEARCPQGFRPRGGGCVGLTAEELARRCQAQTREPCLQACRRLAPDADSMQRCLAAKRARCEKDGFDALACGADLDGCIRWCKAHTRHKDRCIASCRDSFERERAVCAQAFADACEARCPRCDAGP
ncbi:MAG: hypothetical protein JXR96_20125 [Deltaproteobacteria bacterium]|nr:hypothetical protein [Deltaproteobacteria bacterium]